MEKEKIEEEIESIIEENSYGLICKCGGEGQNDKGKKCEICGGTGIHEWDHKYSAKQILRLFKQEKQKLIEDIIKVLKSDDPISLKMAAIISLRN